VLTAAASPAQNAKLIISYDGSQKMFANLTVRMRLTLLLGFLIAAMLAIGGMGVWALQGSNKTIDVIGESYMRPVQVLSDIQYDMLRMRLDLSSSSLRKNPEETARWLKQTEENIADAEKKWKTYLPTISLAEEKKLAEKAAASREQFVQTTSPVVKALKEARYDEASTLLTEKVRPAFRAYETDSKALDRKSVV
jgi:methyl-accepting chemotaxis protein